MIHSWKLPLTTCNKIALILATVCHNYILFIIIIYLYFIYFYLKTH